MSRMSIIGCLDVDDQGCHWMSLDVQDVLWMSWMSCGCPVDVMDVQDVQGVCMSMDVRPIFSGRKTGSISKLLISSTKLFLLSVCIGYYSSTMAQTAPDFPPSDFITSIN